jgi:3-carboxymuconate cyclase
MIPHNPSRRSFVKTSVALAGATALLEGTLRAQPKEAGGPLLAYVGTFSSPLRDTLPTQVDLPPGNGRGIHIFEVDRTTGALTAAGVHELGTSPSCLALNATGTRLYSANETDRVGKDKEGTVSAFAVDRTDGKLKLLNTVRSGGAGPTYVSFHQSGKFMLVANYFGGSVAVLPVLEDGKLGDPTDIKTDEGKIGPTKSANAPKGSFAFSGHDRTHAHMIQADPAGRFVLHVGPGPGQDLRLEVRAKKGTLTANDPPPCRCRRATGRGISTSTPTAAGCIPSRRKARPSCGFDYDADSGRLTPRQTISTLPTGFAGSNFCSRGPWCRPTASSSTPATGCTTASVSSPSAQRAN